MVQSGLRPPQNTPELEADRLTIVFKLLKWKATTPDGKEYQCSVNTPDARGRTALHYAAAWGRDEMCKALVKEGSILTLPDEVSSSESRRTNHETVCEAATYE